MKLRVALLVSSILMSCDEAEPSANKAAASATAKEAEPTKPEAVDKQATPSVDKPAAKPKPLEKGPLPSAEKQPPAEADPSKDDGAEEDPYLADPPKVVSPLLDASLDELIRRSNAISGTMADTLGQETNLLSSEAEKRAVMVLVLSFADKDHDALLSLIPATGIDVGRAELREGGFELVAAEKTHLDRAAVKKALENPASLTVFPKPGGLGILPTEIGDPTKTAWSLERSDDGMINLSSHDTQSTAHLSADDDGKVWLRSVSYFKS